MDRCDDERCQVAAVDDAMLAGHAERRPEQRLRGGRPEQPDRCRPRRLELGLDPWTTGCDFGPARPFMKAPLAAGCGAPLEMLDDVGHEHRFAIQAGVGEGAVKDLAGGTDERAPCAVLDIARLLPDEHDAGMRRTLTEYGLGRALPERARTTAKRPPASSTARSAVPELCGLEGDLGPDGRIRASRVGGLLDHLDLRRFSLGSVTAAWRVIGPTTGTSRHRDNRSNRLPGPLDGPRPA